MKTWNELTELEQLACVFSDVFKDAYGFRPRFDTSEWTVEKFNQEIAICSKEAAAVAAMEQEVQAANAIAIEKRLAHLVSIGAENRETAIRWLAEAEEVDGDMNFLCYKLNIPYGYF